jgi:Ca2+/Na+ antiporter
MVYAIPGSIFAWDIFHPILDMTYVTIALPFGIALFFFFAAVLPNDNTPPKWFLAIAVGGVISGLMWSYLLIGALIDMLELIGVVENLDETFLGLTILAIGNALPDALTTVSLVK